MLNEMTDKLWQVAKKARSFAYTPYSNYKVGAALLGRSGKIYGGCNVENAAYSPGNCAERTAIFKAVSEGERDFVTILVVTANGGTPCGVCRQVLREFSKDLEVIVATENTIIKSYRLNELLLDGFGPEKLA
ncbi:MAG: cytidine deaminase [Deinococcales bacterium]